MSEQQTWPPPPNMPDLTAAHDEFLAACLRAPVTKPPLTRLHLCMNLHKETGLPLRQCLVFVNGYCDRNAILRPGRGALIWFGCLPPLIMMATVVAMFATQFSFQRNLDAATTRAARHAIRAEMIHLDFVFFGIIALCGCAQLMTVMVRTRQTRRDAAHAREKMSGSAPGTFD